MSNKTIRLIARVITGLLVLALLLGLILPLL